MSGIKPECKEILEEANSKSIAVYYTSSSCIILIATAIVLGFTIGFTSMTTITVSIVACICCVLTMAFYEFVIWPANGRFNECQTK